MTIQTPMEIPLANWVSSLKESALQQTLMSASGREVTSFALGLPAIEFFPRTEYAEMVARVLAKDCSSLQYSPPCSSLKTQIVNLMERRGIKCSEEQVFLTAGAQQGMSLLAHLLLGPGATVLMEEMSYTGFKQAIDCFQPTIFTVGTDLETGMDVAKVESALTGGLRPAFIYAVTDGHNPMGVSMSAAKRSWLVSLAREYRIPIVEDDAYGFLNYETGQPPPMRALEPNWVLYVGSFSKILAPSLRTGWIVVPESLITKLAIIKESTDINTATFTQHAIAELLNQYDLKEHLERVRSEYRSRRDVALRILGEEFPRGTQWSVPTSGFFIWVDLPEIDTIKLLNAAISQKLVFIPGGAFAVGEKAYSGSGIRLSFSNCNLRQLEEGMRTLARLAHELRR